MMNPTAAILVIGDEILSGRTREGNAHHAAKRFQEHGLDLREIRIVADEADAISAAVGALSDAYDHVFTSGGIGPTHDDITADCVAQTLGAHIDIRDDALDILNAYYAERDTELNKARMRMARIPDGAELIENPVSAAPGFSLGNVHVMAGVPSIFEAMLEGLLPRLTGGTRMEFVSRKVDRPEGDIAEMLRDIDAAHPAVSIGSYPSRQAGGVSVQVVLRSADADALAAATADLDRALA